MPSACITLLQSEDWCRANVLQLKHQGLHCWVPHAAAAQVQPWWAYEADSEGVAGRQLTGKPSVFFRKTVNAHSSFGEDVAVNAQQYAVLVMDVPDLRPAHARWPIPDAAPACVTPSNHCNACRQALHSDYCQPSQTLSASLICAFFMCGRPPGM